MVPMPNLLDEVMTTQSFLLDIPKEINPELLLVILRDLVSLDMDTPLPDESLRMIPPFDICKKDCGLVVPMPINLLSPIKRLPLISIVEMGLVVPMPILPETIRLPNSSRALLEEEIDNLVLFQERLEDCKMGLFKFPINSC